MEDYPYKNKSLTGIVAEPLILELFDKQTDVPKSVIEEKVTELHLSQGGLPQTSETSFPIVNGLDRLKDKDQANNPRRGFWTINSAGIKEGIPDVPVGDKEIIVGEGASSVYLYYFPTYRSYAELQGEDSYPCKIGRTDASDPIAYINNQAGASLPEKPEPGLIMKTNDPVGLEKRIHRALDNVKLRKEDAPGRNVFLQTLDKLKNFTNLSNKKYPRSPIIGYGVPQNEND